MKTIIALIITAILGFSAQQASAQAYTAKEGMSTALKSADSSVIGAKLVGVLTLGDTTSALQLPIDISFDIKTGKSEGWMYFVSGKSKKTNADTLVSVGVARIFGFFLVLPLDISSLGPISSFFSDPLPDAWINSDEMATKIRANTDYAAFAAKHPDVKPLLVPVSVAVLAQFFPFGTPLWQLSFGGSIIDPGNGPGIDCEVHAVTGEVKCLETVVSVEEDITTDDNFSLAPNPASDAVRFAVPDGLRGGMMSVTVVNTVGQVVFSNNLETSGAESVVVPVTTMADGVYRLMCSANGRTVGATFVVAR